MPNKVRYAYTVDGAVWTNGQVVRYFRRVLREVGLSWPAVKPLSKAVMKAFERIGRGTLTVMREPVRLRAQKSAVIMAARAVGIKRKRPPVKVAKPVRRRIQEDVAEVQGGRNVRGRPWPPQRERLPDVMQAAQQVAVMPQEQIEGFGGVANAVDDAINNIHRVNLQQQEVRWAAAPQPVVRAARPPLRRFLDAPPDWDELV